MMSILCVENVSKTYPVTGGRKVLHALNCVSFSLDRGQCLVLVGQSGSGKSTLLRCLNGLESVQVGHVYLNGQDISLYRSSDALQILRIKVGMVFQQYALWPHMSVINNLTLAPIKVKCMEKSVALNRALKWLERFGILDKANVYPHELSGGQQQKVAIARALMMEPEVLLMDEPTAALDNQSIEDVMQIMYDIKKDGMSIIIATHHLSIARELADYVLFMQNGTVSQQGVSYQIFSPGVLNKNGAWKSFCEKDGQLLSMPSYFKHMFETHQISSMKRVIKGFDEHNKAAAVAWLRHLDGSSLIDNELKNELHSA